MRFLTPILLLLISIALFFTIVDPYRKEVLSLRSDISKYNEALDSSTSLEKNFTDLVNKYKLIKTTDKERLMKLLPDNVNNIRFIIEIENLARKNNLILDGIKFDAGKKVTKEDNNVVVEVPVKEYDIFPVEFTTKGDYATFMKFLKEVESNLRLVDVKSISFSVPQAKNKAAGINANTLNEVDTVNPNIYTYTLKVETYWLK